MGGGEEGRRREGEREGEEKDTERERERVEERREGGRREERERVRDIHYISKRFQQCVSECDHNEEVPPVQTPLTRGCFWNEERVYSQDKMALNDTKEKEKQKSPQDFLEHCRQAALRNENEETKMSIQGQTQCKYKPTSL